MSSVSTKKVFFLSLGCDKNRVDSEQMLGLLLRDGYILTEEEADADSIIINTCCFIDEAKEESIQAVLEHIPYRQKGKCKALVVTGCMSERYREEVLREIPEVDAIVGTHSFTRLPEILEEVWSGRKVMALDPPAEQTYQGPRILTTGGYTAYLKISEGCDRHCTYCAIPAMRGPYRSKPMDLLLQEARDLSEQGVRELILVAQDTSLYGLDLYGEKRLHLLLQQLAQLANIHWIRILYCYPEEIYPELIATIRQEEKICSYLDLPVQHSEDRILRRMGRKMTKDSLRKILMQLRDEIPDIILRTTLLTGFPGETEEEHQALLQFIQEMQFDHLGVFSYSREEGTPAYDMPDQIDPAVMQRRKEDLMGTQQQISFARKKTQCGRIREIFVEGYLPEEGQWVGRTYGDAPDVDGLCFFHCMETLRSGTFVPVRITEAGPYDLIGEYVYESSQ